MWTFVSFYFIQVITIASVRNSTDYFSVSGNKRYNRLTTWKIRHRQRVTFDNSKKSINNNKYLSERLSSIRSFLRSAYTGASEKATGAHRESSTNNPTQRRAKQQPTVQSTHNINRLRHFTFHHRHYSFFPILCPFKLERRKRNKNKI